MQLIIDVSKDSNVIQIEDLEIQLINVPEDRQWKIDDLRAERDRFQAGLEKALAQRDQAEARLQTNLAYAPPNGGVSPAVAAKVLRDILSGSISSANKINCIKFILTITSLSLKEAKDLVDVQIPSTPYFPSAYSAF